MPLPRRCRGLHHFVALDPGTRLGPYEILAPAGAGGMGEVYRARDIRLNRLVAVKILSAATAASPQALERFEREAKAIAALSHPGICSIYDVGTEPLLFLVMELLEGPTLHQQLQRGPFDVDSLIETGLALADALAAAHARGVIHRDLKPANVIVTAHGPKIVDFGLARMTEAITLADSSVSAYPTRAAAAPLTDVGMAVGTVSYMSPEQLRGDQLDARTDLFSMGLILYEMATGRRAFEGSTNAVTSAAILHEQPPPPRHRRPDIPPRLNETILNLLEKDRDVRTQTAAELRAELTRLKRESASARRVDPAPGARQDVDRSAQVSVGPAEASSSDAQVAVGLMRRHPAIVAGVVVGVLLVGSAALYLRKTQETASSQETAPTLSIANLEVRPLTTSGTADLPAITPDGNYVVYVEHGSGGDSLKLRQVATDTTRDILPPEPGVFLRGASITPDNVYVNYVRQGAPGSSELWQMPVIGGAGRRLLRGGVASFSPDGSQMAFTRAASDFRTELVIASSDGSNERILAARMLPERYWVEGPNNSLAPAWSPNGKTVAVLGGSNNGGQVVLVDVSSGMERALEHGPPLIGSGLAWLDNDTLIGSMLDRSIAPLQLWLLSVSSGKFSRLSNDVNQYVGVSITKDRDVVVTARTESQFSILASDAAATRWIEEVPSRPMKGALGFAVRWLGSDLAYVSSSSSGFALFRWHADTRSEEMLARGAGNFSVSRDGSTILFFDYERGEMGRIGVAGRSRYPRDFMTGTSVDGFQLLPDGRRFVAVGGSGDKEVLLGTVDLPGTTRTVTKDRVRFAPGVAGGRTEVSPDERLVAYPSTDDEGRPVIAICDLASCSSRRTLPARTQWRWMPDSRALVYVDGNTLSDLWVQPIDGSPPHQLTHFAADGRRIWDFDWSADGKRLAVARAAILTNIVRLRGLNASLRDR